jgi:F-type H+-transporting ATPase subunit delta
MISPPSANSKNDELPPISGFGVADLTRTEADLGIAVQLLNNDQVRSFLGDPRVTAEGKLSALRQLIEPRVHPVMTRFLIGLISRAGFKGLLTKAGGFAAEHYSAVIIDLAGKIGCFESMARDLILADSALQLEEVRAFLADPHVSEEGKTAALKEILVGKVHPLVLFLMVFLFRTRERAKFTAAASSCLALIAEIKHGVVGEIIAAFPIPEKTLAEIERAASACFGKQLRLSLRLDPEVLGGVMIKAGDIVLDGTIDHQLGAIRRSLLGSVIPGKT